MHDEQALEIGLNPSAGSPRFKRRRRLASARLGATASTNRDGARADFDQQPLEALAMISACHEAFVVVQDSLWTQEAGRAFEWFLGRNDLGLPLYDFTTGGCSDGLHVDRVSENQGAESSLAFHLALAEMNRAEHLIPPAPVAA
jgi:hypothetical protein